MRTMKEILFSLAWIENLCKNDASRCLYHVVLKIHCKEENWTCFVAFPFSSYDLLFLYLKNLAKDSGAPSIDSLNTSLHAGYLEYIENYNQRVQFYAFYLPNHQVWPYKNANAVFLFDDNEY